MDRRLWLRSLKGAPLSVLVALFVFGPANRVDMIVSTGWKKGAVDDALRLLEGIGLVVRPSYRIWSLSDGARQLPLFNYPLNGSSDNPQDTQAVDNSSNYPLNGQLVISSSSSSKQAAEESKLQPDQAILDVCADLGIYGRKRQALSKLEHVIAGGPAYVRAHVAAVSEIGLAIWRMEEGWDAPKSASERPLSDQVPEAYRDVVKR